MKKSIKFLAAAAFTVALVLTSVSCKKGDTGPKGDTGQNGAAGSANISSFNTTTSAGLWVQGCGNVCWAYSYTTTAITQNLLDKGAVMCYLANTSTEWLSMPITLGDLEWYYTYSLNTFTIKQRSISNSTTTSNPGTQTFKIVVIPPAMRKPNVNYKNYSEVAAAHGLD